MNINPSQEWTLAGEAGVELFTQAWLPQDEPRDVIAIAHGYAEHGGRYANLVRELVPRGFALYAIDHRGHGRSGGQRALIDSMERVQADFDRFIDMVRGRHAGMPVKLLGHSMGGSIAFGYALRHPEKLSGLVLSAPAMGGLVTPFQRMVLGVIARFVPGMGTLELPPETVSRDPNVVAAYVNDPLVTTGKVPARTAAELIGASREYPRLAPSMRLPLLIQHGTADVPVPPDDNRALYEAIGSSDKTIHWYEGLYHEIYNEPEHRTVIADLAGWLDTHPRPA